MRGHDESMEIVMSWCAIALMSSRNTPHVNRAGNGTSEQRIQVWENARLLAEQRHAVKE
jgi:hypothetical protein